MFDAVRICNIALARLGDSAKVESIDPPEPSAQAEDCARFYPVALASLLEMHPWNFATRSMPLAQLDEPPPAPWRFAYVMPVGCLRVLDVYVPEAQGVASLPQASYAIETNGCGSGLIFSDTPQAWLRFVFLPEDVSQFPPLFADALAWLLASYLAGPLLKGDVGASMGKACLQQFSSMLQLARTSDSRQRRVEPSAQPAWIAGR